MNCSPVTDTALALGETPFAPGFNAVAFNNSGGAVTLQGSDNGTDYTTLASIEDGAMVQVTLPAHSVKLSAAGTIYLLA